MKTFIRAAVAALWGITASAGFAGAAGSAAQLRVAGPVEAIDSADGTVTVLGQRVHAASLNRLTVGSEVAVFGTVQVDGSIAASSIQVRGLYVPGASSIYLSGTVQKAEPSLGSVVVNGVTVDLTPVMSQGSLSPEGNSKGRASGASPRR